MIQEATLKKYETVQELIKNGDTVQAATKKAKIAVGTFYSIKNRKQPRKRKTASQVITLPNIQTTGGLRMILVTGSPSEVTEAIRGLL